jgi:alpha-amylase
MLARAAAGICTALAASAASAQNVSQPAILQWFEGSYKTIENRTADYFMAGYGGLWTPPAGRADAGNLSVGYDVYDRFDLGSRANPTLYGTENGLKNMISEIHKVGGKSYLDLVWNHDGFSDWSNVDGNGHSFLNAGGYPGFYMGTGTGGNYGDFHNPSDTGDENMQLSGLIDIDQGANNQFIRNPVSTNASNLPAGTVSAYGRLANVPTEANRRFYQDRSQAGINVIDPITGNSTLYNYGPTAATNGTPVTENATGYLMRNARWLIQEIGADGFRLDASKNYPTWVLPYLDKAVYKAITTKTLDNKQQWAYSFGETFDSNWGVLQSRTRLDVRSKPDNEVGGNRDSLDFSLYYAMQANLTGNGLANHWNSVVNSSFDSNDGYANNGSQGVAFVQSHDDSGPAPYLANVAYAYTLLRPGNAIVYYNGKEVGIQPRSFPNPGRDDALGGPAANNKYITTLVDIRNRYGTGNYQQRSVSSGTTTDDSTLVYERDRSVIVGLSNRLDNGWDAVTVQTGFKPGMPLIELTGNAADAAVDPNDQIPSLLIVNNDGTINMRVPRNRNVNGDEHKRGYVMYGPSGPQGSLALSSPTAITTIAADAGAGTNGTARITPIKVIKDNTFTVTLNTNAVNLLGFQRDADADGDNALLKFDSGIDVNNNGQVDFRDSEVADTNTNGGTRANLTTYGFENFTTTHQPGFGSANGNGTYSQSVNAANLSEGYHYIEARAFRHRDSVTEGANPPAIYSSFKEVIYVDRLAPTSAVDSIENKPFGAANDRRFNLKNADKTASNVYVLIDLPASRTDAQVLAALSGNQASQTDRDIWARDLNSATTGNHVLTVVTQEITGNYSIQRFPGQFTQTTLGYGLGDTDRNNTYNQFDVLGFSPVLKSNNTQFNATSDFDGDGLVDLTDAFMYGPVLESAPTVDTPTRNTMLTAYDNLLKDSYVTTGTWNVPANKSFTVNKVTAGATIVPGTSTLSVRAVVGNSLQVQAGAKATVRANGTTTGISYLNSLSLGAGAKLDLNDNDLVVNSGSFSTIQALVLNGYAGGIDTTKTGIISTSGQQAGGTTILALFDNSLAGFADYPSGSGNSIAAGAIVGKYTYIGDTNWDGQVTPQDYTATDSNLGTSVDPAISWFYGDTNFDGNIDPTDYAGIDGALGLGQGNPLAVAGAPVSVPEPSSVLLFTLTGLAALARRHRRNTR